MKADRWRNLCEYLYFRIQYGGRGTGVCSPAARRRFGETRLQTAPDTGTGERDRKVGGREETTCDIDVDEAGSLSPGDYWAAKVDTSSSSCNSPSQQFPRQLDRVYCQPISRESAQDHSNPAYFSAIEADAHVALEHGRVVVRTLRVRRKPVGGHVCHGSRALSQFANRKCITSPSRTT